MAVARQLVIAGLLLLGSFVTSQAATPESRAFSAADEAFRAGFFDRAEKEFAEFTRTYTNSTRIAEAILRQAQARIEVTNYAGALELLSAGELSAGLWRPNYQFWAAETLLRKGDYREAANRFSRVLADFPGFPKQLDAAVQQATAHAKLSEWPAVVNLLTNGVFPAIIRTNPGTEQAFRGFLLLGQAHFKLGNFTAAEAAVAPMATLSLDPKIAWERQYLVCRARLADLRPETALQGVTNLLTLATNTGQRVLMVESIAFQAGVLERLGRADQAIEAYQKNLAEGVSPERLKQALEKISELCVVANRLGDAAAILEKYAADFPASPVREQALLLGGELRLRQHLARSPAEKTNVLIRAEAALQELIKKHPQSALLGKAQLNLGWCFWLEGNLPQSQAAFEAATQKLPDSADRAVAFCKLADVQFQQGDLTNAYSHYWTVIQRFGNLPEVQTNFLELALYQTVRTATSARNAEGATNALMRLLGAFPTGYHVESALLLTGREISRQGNPAAARAVYSEFASAFPSAPGLANVRLAIARTYEEQNDWTNAIAQYDSWTSTYTNHTEFPRAEYYRGLACFQAGRETNALTSFSNVVARFPASDFTPLAQWWIADYHFRTGAFREAELDYQLLFRSTNWPVTELNYQAQMMAGRSAAARRIWSDARDYFTKLWNDTNSPAALRGQAAFALGDTLMSMDAPETNRIANYEEAILVFNRVCETYPTNELSVLACGQKASCLLQWAQFSGDYQAASNSFQQVLDSPLADARARSIARIGLGVVLERKADADRTNQVASLRRALDDYLDVFYGKESVVRPGEKPDPYWTREAGLKAARLAESLQNWQQALGVYEQLQQKYPALRTRWEKTVAKLQEQVASAGHGR